MEDDLLQAALETEESNEAEEELDIYTEEGMENYVDDDGISASEEGFMKGYLDAWKCSTFSKNNFNRN